MTQTPTPATLAEYLSFAIELAAEAGRLTLTHFRSDLTVDVKDDQTPVTVADRRAERLIRHALTDRFPDHAVLGEEDGISGGDRPWRWVIDPIDGTKAFVRGVPLYTVLLALEFEGRPRLGVIHCPPLGETVAAAEGLGCHWNGRRCRVADTDRLDRAWVMATDFGDLGRLRPRFTAALLAGCAQARTWADAYGYLLLVTGRADVALDPVMAPWDIAALEPVVTEAGGRFSDLDGGPGRISALAANPALHEQIVSLSRLDISPGGIRPTDQADN